MHFTAVSVSSVSCNTHDMERGNLIDTNPDDGFMTSKEVRAFHGHVSEMTLWRWTRDLGFPKPARIINRRKFWKRSDVTTWLPPQAAITGPVPEKRRAKVREAA